MKYCWLVFSLIVISACSKEPVETPRAQFSIAYMADCDDCRIEYLLPNGNWKELDISGKFDSKDSDTIIVESGFCATIYAYSNTTDSPEEVGIYVTSDTLLGNWKTPIYSETKLGVSWWVPWPDEVK